MHLTLISWSFFNFENPLYFGDHNEKKLCRVVLKKIYFLCEICMFPDEMEKDELANIGDESVDDKPEKTRKNMYSYSLVLQRH